MVLLIFFIFSCFADASLNEYFTTISWDWVIVVILILLFFMLLVSIIRDNKNREKALNSFFEKEKCKKNGEYKYLKEINNERIHSVEKLQNSILKIDSREDKDIYNEIKKNCKNIFDNNQEEKIFLDIATDAVKHKNSQFSLLALIKQLAANADIQYENDTLPENIIADRENILNILFLLERLQTKEHGIQKPKFTIELLSNNTLKIDIPAQLKMNSTIQKVLENGLKPLFNSQDKKYYGIYLYLVKKLLNQINGLLTLESNNNSTYSVSLTIPIDIIYKNAGKESLLQRRLETPKKALIIADSKTAFDLAAILEEFNFDTEIENFNKLNKEIPNFMDYDTIFMDSNLFEPILTEYLESIKPLSNFQFIVILNGENSHYPAQLVDASIETPIELERVTEIIATLYSSELVTSDTKKESIAKEKPIQKTAPKRVLIADDDRVNRHILEHSIKSYGLSVTAVTNGLEVLKELENQEYDLIILDSVMPHLDGYQTITKIRQDSRFNATPVVIHTSFSLYKSSMENIFQLGFDSYLPNPFNKDELKALLNRYLSTDITTIESAQKPNESKDEIIKSFKEFLAIYSDSDRIIEKYIKEKRNLQAISLIEDLKEIGSKVGAQELNSILQSIKVALEEDKEIDENLIYSLSATLKKLKSNITEQLSKS